MHVHGHGHVLVFVDAYVSVCLGLKCTSEHYMHTTSVIAICCMPVV